MRNVTLTLPDEIAQRARVEAAREGKSLSRFVSELVEKRIGRRKTQLEALEAFLAGPVLPGITEDLPSREELYDERLFRRHEHLSLREGPESSVETGGRDRVARRPRSAK